MPKTNWYNQNTTSATSLLRDMLFSRSEEFQIKDIPDDMQLVRDDNGYSVFMPDGKLLVKDEPYKQALRLALLRLNHLFQNTSILHHAAISEDAKDRLRMEMSTVVETRENQGYELALVVMNLGFKKIYQVAIQREDRDFTDLDQQTSKQDIKNIPNMGELESFFKTTIYEWLNKYGQLLFASHDKKKTQIYARALQNYGFNLQSFNMMGYPCYIILPNSQSKVDFLNHFQKLAGFLGEYWLDDRGSAMGADGDIGDQNHETAVIDTILASHDVPEHKYQEFIDKDDQELLELGFDQEEINALKLRTDARDYGMKNLGWIRVKGTNFQCWNMNPQILRAINVGSWDVLPEPDEEGAPETIDIEVISTRTIYEDVPISIIEQDNPSMLLTYGRNY